MSRRTIAIVTLLAASAIFVEGAALGQQEQNAAPAMVPASTATPAPAGPTSSAGSSSAAATAATAQPAASSRTSAGAPSAPAATPAVREREVMLIEGEKRFATNCGRCHQSPHHFPSRMIATVERHMRVRSTITAEDMRLIMFYLMQ